MELTIKINCQRNVRVLLMPSNPDWMLFWKVPMSHVQTVGFSTELTGVLYSSTYSQGQTMQTLSVS